MVNKRVTQVLLKSIVGKRKENEKKDKGGGEKKIKTKEIGISLEMESRIECFLA